MKPVPCFIALVLLVTPAAAHEADASASLSSLPASVYMINEHVEGLAPGATGLLDVPRGDKRMLAIFSSKELADAFVGRIAGAPALKMAANSFPRNFVRQFQKDGISILLDPLNMTDGGTPVPVDADLAPETKDNPELESLRGEDQKDRLPGAGIVTDPNVLRSRDDRRLSRVMELYLSAKLITGPDYFNAALVLQHGNRPEDYQLAHDLAVVAVAKGQSNNASWLAAASEDRFLMAIGRKQRFGTQLTNPIKVDGAITDRLRDAFNLPPLAEEEEHGRSLSPPAMPNLPKVPAP